MRREFKKMEEQDKNRGHEGGVLSYPYWSNETVGIKR
jgi:hypothetical protein